MNHSSDFWDALAPHHSAIENNYLDLPSLRRIIHDIHQPVLVVGAGQGLIVAALQKKGLHAEGIDLSAEIIRYAKKRRGLAIELQHFLEGQDVVSGRPNLIRKSSMEALSR